MPAGRRPDPRQALGRRGEALAERALERAGLVVLERRYRRRFGEIDLVAQRGSLLVFVEVKSRRGVGYGAPARAVTAVKRRRMSLVAAAYLQQRGFRDRPCRFDVVEVMRTATGEFQANHIVDAFRLWPTG